MKIETYFSIFLFGAVLIMFGIAANTYMEILNLSLQKQYENLQ